MMFRKQKSPGHSRSLPPQHAHNTNLPGYNEPTVNVDILLVYRTEKDTLSTLRLYLVYHA